jgi:hypothetical protein
MPPKPRMRRLRFMVGERSQGGEVILEGVVERWEVKMPE